MIKTLNSIYEYFRKQKDLLLWVVTLISFFSLIGWIIGNTAVISVSKSFIPIAPSTALLFLILGVLFLSEKHLKNKAFIRTIGWIALIVTYAFSILILMEFFLDLSFDVENIFISNPDSFGKVSIGRMSPITAILFTFICISIFVKLFTTSENLKYIGGLFSLLVFFVSFILLIGYLYQAPLLYGGAIIPVALITSICFFLFAIALLQSVEIKYWTFNIIKRNRTQYKLLSAFLPWVVFVILLQGFIETNISIEQNNHTLTTALIILIIVALTIVIVTRASSYLGLRLAATEDALKERTQFLDKVLESSALSTWISDNKGTVIRANPACLLFFGATEKEVIGKYNIFKDSVIEKKGLMPQIKNVFEKGEVANIIVDYDFSSVDHVKVKNATHKIVNSIFTPISDANGKVTNVIVQTIDLSEIKKIEQTAIEERNKAQQYLDIAGVALIGLNADGNVTLINPKGCEILGYTRDEVLGMNWFENFLPEDEYSKVVDVEEKALSGKIDEVRYFENKIKTKTGEERLIAWRNALLIDENGEISGTLSSGEDITEQKQFEKELIIAKERAEENETKLLAALESMADAVFIADAEGKIINVNQAFLDLNEFKSKTELLKTFEEYPNLFEVRFESGELTPVEYWAVPRALRGEIATNQIYIIHRKDKQRTWIGSYNFAPIRAHDHTILGCVVTIRDVTETIRKEKELIIAKEKAEESDKLKTAFLQNMSHEIRTPMNSIMGFASLLEDEEDSNNINNYSNIIYRNSEQLVHIIDDIVLYTQLQTRSIRFNPISIDITAMFNDIKKSFDLPQYKKGIELEIVNNIAENVAPYTDYDKMRQVYVNLISNAFKYTATGRIRFGVTNNNSQIVFFVSDSGMGIPKAEINKIFDRFYRASNVNRSTINGTGLGLSIVMELIELLGGKIWVESQIGSGTTFYFTLPLN